MRVFVFLEQVCRGNGENIVMNMLQDIKIGQPIFQLEEIKDGIVLGLLVDNIFMMFVNVRFGLPINMHVIVITELDYVMLYRHVHQTILMFQVALIVSVIVINGLVVHNVNANIEQVDARAI